MVQLQGQVVVEKSGSHIWRSAINARAWPVNSDNPGSYDRSGWCSDVYVTGQSSVQEASSGKRWSSDFGDSVGTSGWVKKKEILLEKEIHHEVRWQKKEEWAENVLSVVPLFFHCVCVCVWESESETVCSWMHMYGQLSVSLFACGCICMLPAYSGWSLQSSLLFVCITLHIYVYVCAWVWVLARLCARTSRRVWQGAVQ